MSEELVDLGLEGVELLNWLLEDVADHQLGAVVGVELEGRVEQGGERGVSLSLSLSVRIKKEKINFR